MSAAPGQAHAATGGDTARASGAFARILVGYCPTEQGADALALGAGLAAACGAKLSVVSVIPAVWIEHTEPSGRAIIDGDERERAARALHDATATFAEVIGVDNLSRRVEVSSSPARGLHDTAITERADLIVVGSSHRGRIGRVLLGSVGERLLNGAPCAVAVAPRGHASKHRAPLEQILVAFDGSAEAGLALRAAHTLAQHVDALLRVVTVVVPSSPSVAVGEAVPLGALDARIPTAASERLETVPLPDGLKRQESTAWAMLEAATADLDNSAIERQVLLGPDPATTILNAARDRTDLLVLGSRAYGPLRRALLGSTSTHLLRRARCPVLVMPRADEADAGSGQRNPEPTPPA